MILSSFPDVGANPSDFDARKESFYEMYDFIKFANSLVFLLIISYIVYLFKTNYVPKDKKALWAVVIILFAVIAMPIFWYLYVWKPIQDPTDEAGPAT